MDLNSHLVVLRPHPACGGDVAARLNVLLRVAPGPELSAEFKYEAGENARIHLPRTRGGNASRQDRLWETTCFELFLQPERARPAYWEINVSPAGDWNAYVFSRYREGQRVEMALGEVRLEHLHSEPDVISCGFRFRLPPAIRGTVRLGVTAVIETVDGDKVYWAAAHVGAKPDFHLAESFNQSIEIGT